MKLGKIFAVLSVPDFSYFNHSKMETETLPETSARLANPFPGLRPFHESESSMYFGRSKQAEEVLDKLITNRFVSIIGTSGIGKSSFIYCGILPKLRAGLATENGSDWMLISLRPGDAPLKNLANAFLTNKASGSNLHLDLNLADNPTSLFDYLKSDYRYLSRNHLIFIDQFEELFRLSDKVTDTGEPSEEAQEAQVFVKLLLEAVAQTEVPIYLIITMRSDFVGSCSQYPKLTQAINQSQFLIPYMTLEEKREAITGPIEIAGGKIEDSLVDKILQDVGNKPDQLPIMQHALMRTWNQWQAKGDVAMSLGHYTDIGGMEKALSQHANEAFMSLEENQREMCGKVFRTITEITAEGNRVRRPTKLAQIAVITGEPIDEISQIVQAFRRSDRGLLMPPESEALTESSIIDISHESLLRIWGMLAEWVREEAESVEMYLRLAVDAERQQQGGTGHWQGLDLELGQRWQRTQKPTKEWGLRYHPTYERTILFLETSIGKAKQAIQDRENAQQRKQQRNRVAMIGLVATLVIFGILTFVAWFQSETARRAQKKATENAALAESKRKEAEKNLQEADRQRDKAKKEQDKAYFERQRAEKAQLKAEEEQRLAEINKKIAEEQAVIASNARDNALKQQRLAELAGKRAKIQAEIAQISAELAQLQEAETRRAKAETERLQLLALARSMAIKSKQIDESNVKGQIARQAYNFYQTAKETHQDNDPDIYTGLYYTLKELKGDDYNKLISHQANVRALVQGNGSEVYSAGADGKIIHWNTQSNQATDSAKKSTVHRTLSISPNKKILACAGNYPYIELLNANQLSNTIQKINLQIGRQVWFVGFMNDNTLISVEDDGKLILWNLQGNKADSVKTKQLEGKITAVAVHNQKIVVAGNKGVRLLSIPSLEESIFNSATGILSIAFNKAGTKIAMGDMQSLVKVYSTATKQQLGENLKGHKARVNTLCFNDDDTQLASASFDNTVRVWNIEPGKYDSPPIILDDHRDWVWSVCFSTDKRRILAGCRDNVVRLWATQINEMATEVCTKIKDDISPKDWKRFVGESIRKVESVCK